MQFYYAQLTETLKASNVTLPFSYRHDTCIGSTYLRDVRLSI